MVISLHHIYQLLVLFHDNHPITANDLHDSFQGGHLNFFVVFLFELFQGYHNERQIIEPFPAFSCRIEPVE